MRPITFDEIVGNDTIKSVLIESIKSAKKRNVRLEHIFLSGPSGCGKSTFAGAISHEMGNNFEYIMCNGESGMMQTITLKLMKMKDGDLLFLDEIHSLKMDVFESIYDYLENGKLSIKYGTQIVTVKAPDVTVLGATTEMQKIPIPFVNRYPIQIKLDKYNYDELGKIVLLNAKSEGLNMEMDGAIEIAKASKGTPRMAVQYVKRVRDHVISNDIKGVIDKDTVHKALQMMGIDENGLDIVERKYIKALFDVFQMKATGLNAICAVIGEHEAIIEKQYEPALMNGGYILKTPNGRALTDKGMLLGMQLSN